MIGAIIGAIGSVASSAVGGAVAAKRRREEQRALEEERQRNKAWYERRYNEDATQRADAQRALTRLREQIQANNRAAQGRQAVMGGTEESVVATQQANAGAMADATSKIVADAETRKDKIEETYLTNDSSIAAQQRAVKEQQAQDITAATTQAIGAAAQLGAAISSKTPEVTGGNTTVKEDPAKTLNAEESRVLKESAKPYYEKEAEKTKGTYYKPWTGNAWPS